jgi:hypothetical protein
MRVVVDYDVVGVDGGLQPERLLRPVEKRVGARQRRARIVLEIAPQGGRVRVEVRRAPQHRLQLVGDARPLPPIGVHGQGRAALGLIVLRVLDEPPPDQIFDLRACIGRRPVELPELGDPRLSQLESAVAGAALLQVGNLLVVGPECGDVVHRGRRAELPHGEHRIAALEALDVAVRVDELPARCAQPDGGKQRDLAPFVRVDGRRDRLAACELGQLCVRQADVVAKKVGQVLRRVGRRLARQDRDHHERADARGARQKAPASHPGVPTRRATVSAGRRRRWRWFRPWSWRARL